MNRGNWWSPGTASIAVLALGLTLGGCEAQPAGTGTIAADETTLLDFYADWCGPCNLMLPTIAKLDDEGYPVRKVNVDVERELADQFDVLTIPCLVLVVNGREVDRIRGVASAEQLVRMFKKHGIAPQ